MAARIDDRRDMSDYDALENFLNKWRVRWPEWAVAEVFVPQDQRLTALAWAALLQEFTDAAWGGSDARPGEAKLGWWVEELQGWTQGSYAHPLGMALLEYPAPWPRLGEGLPALRDSRERPIDADDACAQLATFAGAVAAIEPVLFGNGGPTAGRAIEAVTTTLLHARVAHHPGGAAPLQVLAKEGDSAALAAWTRELAGRAPARDGTRPRRLWADLALARLRRGDALDPLPMARTVWVAWRAARG